MVIREEIGGYFNTSMTMIGTGAALEISKKIQELGGRKPLVVSGKGITKAGITKQITDLLNDEKMEHVVFDEVVPNPTDTNVHDGVAIYKKHGCDSLITVGGGSSHDCGKGIGLLVAHGGRIQDFEGLDRSSRPLPPLIAVNTTAGTASEMTRFCCITDTTRRVKMTIVDWRCVPAVAIEDPLLMREMPPALTAATGMDALAHAVEAYVSTSATSMTDSAAEEAIELIAQHLRRSVANGEDLDAREGMCFAQYLAGKAYNHAGLGYVHAMAHQLGGFYNLPHSECSAILLPHVCAVNLVAQPQRFAKVAQLLGEDTEGLTPYSAALHSLDAFRRLSSDIGIAANLATLGRLYGKDVRVENIPAMATHAMNDVCAKTNPRPLWRDDLISVYRASL